MNKMKCIYICVEGDWKAILENISTAGRDSNIYYPVIGSLAYCKSSALDPTTTERGMRTDKGWKLRTDKGWKLRTYKGWKLRTYKGWKLRTDKGWKLRTYKGWKLRTDKGWKLRTDKGWKLRPDKGWKLRTYKGWKLRINKGWKLRTDKGCKLRPDKGWKLRTYKGWKLRINKVGGDKPRSALWKLCRERVALVHRYLEKSKVLMLDTRSAPSSSPMASLVLTYSSQLTSDSQHLESKGSNPPHDLTDTWQSQNIDKAASAWRDGTTNSNSGVATTLQASDTCYSSPTASLVLTDSSQLTSDSQHLEHIIQARNAEEIDNIGYKSVGCYKVFRCISSFAPESQFAHVDEPGQLNKNSPRMMPLTKECKVKQLIRTANEAYLCFQVSFFRCSCRSVCSCGSLPLLWRRPTSLEQSLCVIATHWFIEPHKPVNRGQGGQT
uniref:(California timema) hypothetical protein n=1 Tax=Timema californicum TaxID=61474 RepID=A0A7R9P741_TIMCA|nr:unnamed protein product [Timema californicum]